MGLCLLSVSQPPYLASMLVAWPLSLAGEHCHLEDPSLTNSRRLMSTSSPTPSVQATTAPTASPPPWSVLLTLARTPAKETLVVPWSPRRMEDMPDRSGLLGYWLCQPQLSWSLRQSYICQVMDPEHCLWYTGQQLLIIG